MHPQVHRWWLSLLDTGTDMKIWEGNLAIQNNSKCAETNSDYMGVSFVQNAQNLQRKDHNRAAKGFKSMKTTVRGPGKGVVRVRDTILPQSFESDSA